MPGGNPQQRCDAGADPDARLARSGGLADQTAGETDRSREDMLSAVGKGRPLGRMAEP